MTKKSTSYDYDKYLEAFATACFESYFISADPTFSHLDLSRFSGENQAGIMSLVFIELCKLRNIHDYDEALLTEYKEFSEWYFSLLDLNSPQSKSLRGFALRMCTVKYWNRKQRLLRYRLDYYDYLLAGLISKEKTWYVPRHIYESWHNNRVDAVDYLSSKYAVSDEGDVCSLKDAIDSSDANPGVRFSSLMCRIKGLEKTAIEHGHVCNFYTLTCPSRFHSSSDKYDGSTPVQAQRHLRTLFSRARTAFRRAGVSVYGLRVCEPHKDGCPHWHMLFFMAPEHSDKVTSILKTYALQDEGSEKGADDWVDDYGIKRKGNRFDFKRIDLDQVDEKGLHRSAAGYVIKYISKSTGFTKKLGADSQDIIDNELRVVCWSSIWRIRQFQFIGTPPKSLWDESRRLGQGDKHINVNKLIESMRLSATASDYASFIEVLGGIGVKRSDLPVKIHRSKKLDSNGDYALNEYFEEITRLNGMLVIDTDEIVVTRSKNWSIVDAEDIDDLELKCEGFEEGGASRIHNNKCTIKNSDSVLLSDYLNEEIISDIYSNIKFEDNESQKVEKNTSAHVRYFVQKSLNWELLKLGWL